jgi:hypothetical protein
MYILVSMPFHKVRSEGKTVVVMGAFRGTEKGITKERKIERRRQEKAKSQKEYRMAHPEIPWHERGFQGDCHCIECTQWSYLVSLVVLLYNGRATWKALIFDRDKEGHPCHYL